MFLTALYWFITALDVIALTFMVVVVLFVIRHLVRGGKFEPSQTPVRYRE